MANNIGKSAAVLTVSKFLTTMITLVSSMMLSRFRSLEEYGTYSQINLVISIAISMCMFGLPDCTNYFLARAETQEERRRFLSVYYTLNTILSFAMGAVLAFSIPLIVRYFSNPMIVEFTYILVVLPWTKVIIDSIRNILVVYQKTHKLMLVNILNGSISLISITLVQLFGWTFREYMFVYLLGEVCIMVWVYVIVWKIEASLAFLLDKKLILAMVKYALPVGLATLVGTINLEIDKLMIGKLYDTQNLAIYTNAARELPVTVVATSLTAVVLPQISRLARKNDLKQGLALWGKTIELSYIFMAFVVTTLVVFAPQIITLLYSEKYLAGVSVFRIYSTVLLLRTTYFGMILSAIGQTKSVLSSSVITLVVNVILNYICYVWIGFCGPAVATFVSIIVAAVSQLWNTSKACAVPIRKVWPWGKLLKHTVINLGWGIPAAFVLNFGDVGVSMLEIILCMVVGAGIVLGYILVERRSVISLWTELNGAE